jgi:hypothetical protein
MATPLFHKMFFNHEVTMTLQSKSLVGIIAAALFISGCASVVVNNDVIENNTASALGLSKSSFTISDRNDEGLKSSYLVKTNDGRNFSCYVVGSVGITGKVISDAVCKEFASEKVSKPTSAAPAPQPIPTPTKKQPEQQCNALLKAAGKC